MLGKVRIVCDREQDTTAVSNTFIDHLMVDANEAQIKTYLYLLRAMQAGLSVTVSGIADAFNHTEREVKRALTYWEKKGLVRLEYDSGKRLTQIALEDPLVHEGEEISPVASPAVAYADEVREEPPKKRKYSGDEIRHLQEDESLSMTLYAAEKYFRRVLNPTEIQTILYIYDDLGFPADLLDYLLQYVAENAKGRPATYLEKTAIAWHRDGIRTQAQAMARAGRFDKRVYEIMNSLGLSGNPTPFENGYFEKWLNTYGFSMDLITEACRRTVFNTQTHRVEYADGILTSWHKAGVKTLSDVERLDRTHEAMKGTKQRKKASGKQAGDASADTRNRFNRMTKQDYDYEALRQSVVSNQ